MENLTFQNLILARTTTNFFIVGTRGLRSFHSKAMSWSIASHGSRLVTVLCTVCVFSNSRKLFVGVIWYRQVNMTSTRPQLAWTTTIFNVVGILEKMFLGLTAEFHCQNRFMVILQTLGKSPRVSNSHLTFSGASSKYCTVFYGLV